MCKKVWQKSEHFIIFFHISSLFAFQINGYFLHLKGWFFWGLFLCFFSGLVGSLKKIRFECRSCLHLHDTFSWKVWIQECKPASQLFLLYFIILNCFTAVVYAIDCNNSRHFHFQVVQSYIRHQKALLPGGFSHTRNFLELTGVKIKSSQSNSYWASLVEYMD